MRNVLIFGAGHVSAPCVDYLVRKGRCQVIISDINASNLQVVKTMFPNVDAVNEDASIKAEKLINEFQPKVVINLLPTQLMPYIANICLEKKAHMIHPAYQDEQTKAMAADITKAGLIFIVELGLDPGIDHMSAAKTINEIHSQGGKIESFQSLCGALPAAEANTNPWGYKLSWSPASLIGASKRTAKILQNNEEILWPDGATYEHAHLNEIQGLGLFEVYANADATIYRESYNMPEVHSIYRGTYRYPGWCETICYLNEIGFFDTEKRDTNGMTFAQFTARQTGEIGDVKNALIRRLRLKPWSAFIMRIEWLGLLENRPLPFISASPRDVISYLFGEKLFFTQKERDMVVLSDNIIYRTSTGNRRQHKSTLIDFGVPEKWSSVAKTTGLPPAIAARYILDGVIGTPGLHMPILPEIYIPVLEELKLEGITLEESVETI